MSQKIGSLKSPIKGPEIRRRPTFVALLWRRHLVFPSQVVQYSLLRSAKTKSWKAKTCGLRRNTEYIWIKTDELDRFFGLFLSSVFFLESDWLNVFSFKCHIFGTCLRRCSNICGVNSTSRLSTQTRHVDTIRDAKWLIFSFLQVHLLGGSTWRGSARRRSRRPILNSGDSCCRSFSVGRGIINRSRQHANDEAKTGFVTCVDRVERPVESQAGQAD